MKIAYSKKFVSEFRKLPKNIQFLAVEREKIFKKNPFDPRLKTHKLTGKLKGNLAFSINYQYRIILYTEGRDEYWFISIGTHNIYRN